MMRYSEDKIDNGLVRAKNNVLDCLLAMNTDVKRVDDVGYDVQRMKELLTFLELSLPVWSACGYAYKGAEIAGRISDIVVAWQDTLGHYPTIGTNLALLQTRALRMVDEYRAAQQEYMYG
jgi:hypothetical protein